MNIVVLKLKKLIKIFIEESMSIKDVEVFLEETENKNILYEISFMNIMVIPLNVIKRIYEIQENTKLFTNEISLKHYLLDFNIKIGCEDCFLNTKQINKINYIGIGGSAGSLEKISNIIKELPPSDISIFIVVHQNKDKKSLLYKILQNQTNYYKVIEAVSDQRVMPKTIYTAPPGKHMIVAGGYIFLTDGKKKNFAKPSISVLFNSLANEYNQELLCLLVCGYGKDGSDSLENLKNNSATILLEDPNECEATPMIDNASQSGNYNAILPLKDINKYIYKAISTCKELDNKQIDLFLKDIYNIYGYDYTNYHKSHILRRINHFYNLVQPKDFNELKKIILADKTIFKKLFLDISINVTTLFRDSKTFKKVKENLLPKLDSFAELKIWCAGCSTGEEPYSLAILLNEAGLLDRSIIYATDINKIVLKKAKNGIYSKNSYNLFTKHYYQSGGEESFSNYFDINDDFVIVKDFIKEKVLFYEHNLAMDSIINQFQLIFCRNVLIYFDKELKTKVFKLFNESLENYGFLVLGDSEMIDKNLKDFKKFDSKIKIYQKTK